MTTNDFPSLRSIVDAGGCPIDVMGNDEPVWGEMFESIGDLLGGCVGDRGYRERQLEDRDMHSWMLVRRAISVAS